MRVINSIKESLAKLSPEQRRWLTRVLMITGLALMARAILAPWPSIDAVLIKAAIFAVVFLCYGKVISVTPSLRGLVKWLILLSVGTALNFSVCLANDGFMPAVNQEYPAGMYIPIEGAKLLPLCDWIATFISPGDVLVIVAFFGIIATMVANRQQKAVEQA